MNKPGRTLRERLLDMETPKVSPKEAYERQVQVLLRRRLSVPARVGLGLVAILGVLLVRDFLYLWRWALPPDGEMSRSVTGTVWFVGVAFGAVYIVLSGYAAVWGRLGSRIRPSLIAGAGAAMAFVYMVVRVFGMEYPLLRHDPHDGRILLVGQLGAAVFFLLILGGLYLILRVVYRMEFKTQEKLLQLEYRLAELGEKIDKHQSR
jgi:hypothetical protein